MHLFTLASALGGVGVLNLERLCSLRRISGESRRTGAAVPGDTLGVAGGERWDAKEKLCDEKEEQWLSLHAAWLEERRVWEAVKVGLLREVVELRRESRALKDDLFLLSEDDKSKMACVMSLVEAADARLAKKGEEKFSSVKSEWLQEAVESECSLDNYDMEGMRISHAGVSTLAEAGLDADVKVVRAACEIFTIVGPESAGSSGSYEKKTGEMILVKQPPGDGSEVTFREEHLSTSRRLKVVNVDAYVQNALKAIFLRGWLQTRMIDENGASS